LSPNPLVQEPEAIANYRYLYALLRRERDRAAASPALRLLDDVLSVLGEGAAAGAGREAGGPDAAEARRRAATMMRDAFTGGERPRADFPPLRQPPLARCAPAG
jgi:hypothetical protein